MVVDSNNSLLMTAANGRLFFVVVIEKLGEVE